MRKSDALSLASQLNLKLTGRSAANSLWDQCSALGYTVAIDNATGSWVVLDASERVLATAG